MSVNEDTSFVGLEEISLEPVKIAGDLPHETVNSINENFDFNNLLPSKSKVGNYSMIDGVMVPNSVPEHMREQYAHYRPPKKIETLDFDPTTIRMASSNANPYLW